MDELEKKVTDLDKAHSLLEQDYMTFKEQTAGVLKDIDIRLLSIDSKIPVSTNGNGSEQLQRKNNLPTKVLDLWNILPDHLQTIIILAMLFSLVKYMGWIPSNTPIQQFVPLPK